MTQVINFVAWALCFVAGGFLFGDFIRTELSFKSHSKDAHTEQEVSDHDSHR